MKCQKCGWDDGALTAREAEVEELMITGLKRKEVAARLGILPKTIDVHAISIYRKRGVRTIAQLILQHFKKSLEVQAEHVSA